MHRQVCKRGSRECKNERVYETWSKVEGQWQSFSDAAFIAVTLSIPLAFALFSSRKLERSWRIFPLSRVTLSVRAAEDLYQVRGGVAPILRERCDKVTLRNWLSWRGERLAEAEGKLSLGEPRLPFSLSALSFLPSFRLLNPTRSYFVPELLLDDFFLLHFKRAQCYFARQSISGRKRESRRFTRSWAEKNLIQSLSCHERRCAWYAVEYRDYSVTVSIVHLFKSRVLDKQKIKFV